MHPAGELVLRDLLFFLKGMIVGFAVAIPLGPAALLCIRQTLHRGIFWGLISGLGIATADTFYGSIAGLGLTSIADIILGWFSRLRLAGGGLLLVLGGVLYFVSPPHRKETPEKDDILHTFFSTFGMTLANPLILFIFAAVFAAVGLDNFSHDFDLVGLLILGIFTGSLAWWLCLCGAMSLLHRGTPFALLGWSNKISGLLLIFFGIYTLYGGI